jgi:hydroxypyruvate isomerase
MKISANLGFLWTERPLPEAVRAAKAAGFDAVELHWPYDTPTDTLRAVLEETGLPVLSLNTRRGNVAAGENGLAALRGREAEARAAIAEALAYGAAIGAGAVHVMAGNAAGAAAEATLHATLAAAAPDAAARGMTLLIEPLNRHDAPDYFLRSTDQAAAIIRALDTPAVRLMFDCYHVGRTEGDVLTRLADLLPLIGHIQFAAVPDRGPPDHGELHMPTILSGIAALGWVRPLGAEYKPGGPTEPTLDWLRWAQAL